MTDRNKSENLRANMLSTEDSIGLGKSIDHGPHSQSLNEPESSEIYSGVGLLLRVERERLQISLSEVSDRLRIQRGHLVALEEGRTFELPGPTYAAGFLRTYSVFLGLDGEEIVRQYKKEGALTSGEQRLIFLEPLEEARRPGLTLALISLIVAGIVYGSWIFLERRNQVVVETISEPPQRFLTSKAETKVFENEPDTKFQARLPEYLRDKKIKTKISFAPDELQSLSEPRDEAIGENKVTKINGENTSERNDSNLNTGEGERAAAADVVGLGGINIDRPVNVNAELSTNKEAAKLKMIIEKPLELTDSEKYKIAVNNSVSVLPNPSNKKIKGVNAQSVVPTIRTAVMALGPNSPVQPLPGVSADTSSNGDKERVSRPGTSEMMDHRPGDFGTSDRNGRVILLARRGSWMQVRGANGELLLRRMLRPGDSYHAPNRGDLVLMTGNAGAIDVMIDGKIWGPLGFLGQVRRNIKLNADNLRKSFHVPATSNQ